jgi:excisionase family DNA binding protein
VRHRSAARTPNVTACHPPPCPTYRNEPFYPVTDFVHQLDVSERSVCRWIHEGRIKAAQIVPGGAVRIPRGAAREKKHKWQTQERKYARTLRRRHWGET